MNSCRFRQVTTNSILPCHARVLTQVISTSRARKSRDTAALNRKSRPHLLHSPSLEFQLKLLPTERKYFEWEPPVNPRLSPQIPIVLQHQLLCWSKMTWARLFPSEQSVVERGVVWLSSVKRLIDKGTEKAPYASITHYRWVIGGSPAVLNRSNYNCIITADFQGGEQSNDFFFSLRYSLLIKLHAGVLML